MPTNTPRLGLSKPASGDLVSSYPATIGPSFNTIDAEMLRQRGAWSSATAYAVNDLVSVGGAVYVAIATSTNQTPPNATYWQPFGTTPAQLTAHEADTTAVHGIADTSALETTTGSQAKVNTHAAAADPHPVYLTSTEANSAYEASGAVATHAAVADPHTGYQKESEKDQANGYPGLNASGFVVPSQLGSGTRDSTKFLRDDGTWQTVAGGGGGAPTGAQYVTMASDATLTAETLYSALNGRGLLSARPAPGIPGRRYHSTDVNGGTTSYDTGGAWVAEAPGLTEAPAAHRATHLPGGSDTNFAFVRKTANETLPVSSTTPQDDDHLFFSVAANEVWKLELVIFYEAVTASDIAFNLTLPTGCAGRWGAHALGNTAATNTDVFLAASKDITANLTSGGATATVVVTSVLWGLLRVGANGGTVRLQTAQRVSDPTAPIVYADSYIYGVRVAG